MIWNMAMNACGKVWKLVKCGTVQKSWRETADAKMTKVTVKITSPPSFLPGLKIL